MGRGTRAPSGVRPTAQRVRTALFNSLGARVQEADVLDLFAGTGALGLEALDRGARAVVFVERDPPVAAALRKRLRAAGLTDRAQVRRAAVRTALRDLAAEGRHFDLILLDPPYGHGLLAETLEALAAGDLVRAGGRVVAEGHWRDAAPTPAGLACVRRARYGETALWVYARADESGIDMQEEADRADGDLSGQF